MKPPSQRNPNLCYICKKRIAKEFYFCETCINKKEQTFEERLRVVISKGRNLGTPNKIKLLKGGLSQNG